MAKGGGGSTTATRDPWSGAQPYLTDIFSKAQDAFNAVPKAPYSGNYVAAPTTDQRSAISLMEGLAGSSAGMGNQTNDLSNFFSNKVQSGAYTAPLDMTWTPRDSSTTLLPAIQAAIRPVTDNFSNSILPQLKSAGIDSGAYGGSKYSSTLAQETATAQQHAQDIASTLGYTDYNNQQQRSFEDLTNRRNLAPQLLQEEQNAGQLVPQLAQAGFSLNNAPIQLLNQAGTEKQSLAQNVLDNEQKKFDASQSSPFAGLADYLGLISGAGTSKNGTTTTQTKANPFTSILQGGLGGAMAGSAFGASSLPLALGMSTPWTFPFAAAGAGLGGALGLL